MTQEEKQFWANVTTLLSSMDRQVADLENYVENNRHITTSTLIEYTRGIYANHSYVKGYAADWGGTDSDIG